MAAQGDMANVWSKHFETVVQEAIDATTWKPSSELAALRGRKLKAGPDDITDLDAVGEHSGKALLVSCKCIPFSQAWNRGEYGAC